ncbi:hypothetical protein OIV83_002878 [Microbotryomycetes sp. JL201]|nr:hypothetical protein OIV83_002878 [Microbotryomycetes sp. JL201]
MSFSSLYGLVPNQLRPATPQSQHAAQRDVAALQGDDSGEADTQIISSNERTATTVPHATTRSATMTAPRVREAELQLSADCPHCSGEVVIKVPKYMMQAMAPAAGRMTTPQDEFGYGHAHHHLVEDRQQQADTMRERVVNLAVKAATAFKESRLPALIAGVIRATIALVVYLDQTFSIHQRLIMVFWIVLADLQRIEQEVGLLRNSGDAISVLWEAFVKGAIGKRCRISGTLGKPERGTNARQQFDQNQQYRGSNLAGSPSMPNLGGPPGPSGYLQPPYTWSASGQGTGTEDNYDHSAGISSSSEFETNSVSSRASNSKNRPKTLRRMHNSVPSFHNDVPGSRSGASTPGSHPQGHSSANEFFEMSNAGGMRPRLGRQRSRSGPHDGTSTRDDPSRTPTGRERGWVASRVAGVAGAVLPGMRG